MNSKPKIFVFKMRELIYTLVLAFLAILLIVCLVLMFTGKSKPADSTPGSLQMQSDSAQSDAQTAPQTQTDNTQSDTQAPQNHTQNGTSLQTGSPSYTPGVYTTPVTLGSSAADVEVTVDSNHINGIRLVNLSESTAASYPLVTPSLEHIAEQILESQSLENITCPQENKYTSQLLLSAIAEALDTARQSPDRIQ